MTLDIALPSPGSTNPAGGGPPGAGPPMPEHGPQAFAAMLAQHKRPATRQTPGAGPNTADNTRDNKTRSDRNDKRGDKDAAPDTALSKSSPVSVQALPTEATALAALIAPPGPPVPIVPAPSASTASSVKTSEAMDTSLPGATASPGGTALPTGGELLPQTVQTPASPDGHASASFSLPDAALPSASAPAAGLPTPAPAGPAAAGSGSAASQAALSKGAASAQSLGGASALPGAPGAVPDPGAAQPTKIALQGYAQFGQTGLQNMGRPANNTGKGGDALESQAAGAAGNSAALPGSLPAAALPASLAEMEEQAGQEWAASDKSEDNAARDTPGASGDGVSQELMMPTTPGTSETTPAAVSTGPMLPQERAALMQQAADSMQALRAQVVGHGQGQMTLQLHPQDWGKLQVSVTMTPDATGSGGTVVTAHLVADNASVKQALETSGADLRRTLREAGLHLETMTVTVRPPSASTEAQNMGGSFSGDRGQSASQDAQAWTTPGSRGENALGSMAGNGQPSFGGGGAHTGAQNPQHRQAALMASAPADDYEAHVPQAVSASGAAGRLDTRA